MRARFLRPAEIEVVETVAYLDQQRERLGDRFEQDLIEALAVITADPNRGKPLSRLVRKFRLRKFRYNVIYVVDEEEVIIVAVAHDRRRPGYWTPRLAQLR